MKIKYSFVIPVYGCEQYLEECVDSILAQKGDHSFEVILVDDGSRDRSGQIADMLASRDNRIRTFHKENGGAASARNFGLQQIRGEWLIFVDADDTITEDYLVDAQSALEDYATDMLILGIYFDYYRSAKLIRSQLCGYPNNCVLDQEKIAKKFDDFFTRNCFSSACSKIFRAQIIKNNELLFNENLVIYEDLEFVLKYLFYANKITVLSGGYYHYRNCLEASRYSEHIADLEKVNYLIEQLHVALVELNCLPSMVESTILAQVIITTLKESALQPFSFVRKVDSISNMSEFCRLSSVMEENGKIDNLFIQVKNKAYGRLWVWSVYRVARNTAAKYIKGLVSLCAEKWLRETI